MKTYTDLENPEKMVWNGFEYAVQNNEAIVTYYLGTETDIAIPKIIEGNKVTKIADSLFTVPEIVSIIIPNGVKHIIKSFGSDTYRHRRRDENPNWLLQDLMATRKNGKMTFEKKEKENCLSYVELPQTLVSISNNAFFHNQKLFTVTIPNSLVYIGIKAFQSCKGICIDKAHPEYVLENNCLIHKKTKTLHSYIDDGFNTSCTIADGIEHIANEAFSECKLENISIPSTVKTIGDLAFTFCDFLSKVEIPDSVTSIGKEAFSHCVNLKSVRLPNVLDCIERSTFAYCRSLTEIYIPNTVKNIKQIAFLACDRLKKISLPSELAKIGSSAFEMCNMLNKIDIPDSTTIIEHSAFGFCENLESVTLSSKLTSIGALAFCECKALKTIEIPETVTSIGQSAFVGCTSLSEVIIPHGVFVIMDDAFLECPNLVLKVKENSYEHEYAKKNGIPFELWVSNLEM